MDKDTGSPDTSNADDGKGTDVDAGKGAADGGDTQPDTDAKGSDSGDGDAGKDSKGSEDGDGKGSSSADTDKKDGDDAKDVGAPESGYKDFNAPEGVELDKGMIGEFMSVAKDLNLTQEQAQKLVDMDTERVLALNEAQDKLWEEVQNDRISELKADKDFGGDNFDKNVERANNFVKTFGEGKDGEDLKNALIEAGVDALPQLLKAFAKVSAQTSEDDLSRAGADAAGGGAAVSDADAMYAKVDVKQPESA